MMRYFEIASGMQMPVSSEEWTLLRRIIEAPVRETELDERDGQLARRMLSRGLLDYYKRNDETFYRASSINDIWRDRDG
jgi:hypothetical protein